MGQIKEQLFVLRRSNKPVIASFVVAAALGVLFAGPARAQSISTLPQWDGATNQGVYAVPNTTTYGQTITVATPEYLNDFTFEVETTTPSTSILSTPYVFAWNGHNATGSPLFTGSTVTFNDSAGFEPFTTNTGNTLLNPGQYVLLFSSSTPADYTGSTSGSGSGALWGTVYEVAGEYTGGDFVVLNNGENFSALTSGPWNAQNGFEGQSGYDTAFSATLAPVPEPTSLSLLAVGGVALLRRRRIALRR